jgi:hypothetical protein
VVVWFIKNDSEMENELKDYLFKDDQDVTEIEEESK